MIGSSGLQILAKSMEYVPKLEIIELGNIYIYIYINI